MTSCEKWTEKRGTHDTEWPGVRAGLQATRIGSLIVVEGNREFGDARACDVLFPSSSSLMTSLSSPTLCP